ncbi:molybdopterin-guanine dinucleotide biosynthesis protein B [Peteryoungia desertarenae]|uniref:Molybdopterin-guanine dinucleotide biosynthesis protein B n=1 Tax=Peteryoungia desertarenae TaxID=1813451 RepID=A0ABX6QQ88_9HYPH|nr:molybdopterin-guanine dinucleotide biosynthesis protein B [Peteryoungia desertarenae]QLF70746.1 molybdopterin-guanine dinucleotide biosynthesis protein B [Peteryoungia desertarenae]
MPSTVSKEPKAPLSAEKPRVFGIAGWKNSGKTDLTTRLVSELTQRGFAISTVKHAHHDFDIDKTGSDSFRHREAGAQEVALVSGTRYAIMHELRSEDEPSLEHILSRMGPSDLVLVEGYKREPIAKIETRRREARTTTPLAPNDPLILAIASDHPVDDADLPIFDLDDTQAIADFIMTVTGLSRT